MISEEFSTSPTGRVIKNTILEELFLRVAKESTIESYFEYDGHEKEWAMKTMLASRTVKLAFNRLLAYYEMREGKVFVLGE